MEIKYVKGDATKPIGFNIKVIAHVCNDTGKWGAGFTRSVDTSFPNVRYYYESLPKNLGDTQFIKVDKELFVCNMIAMEGVYSKSNKIPLRYNALEECLKKLNNAVEGVNYVTVHMPRIGCGLARGEWKTIEKMIKEHITVDCYVYDLY